MQRNIQLLAFAILILCNIAAKAQTYVSGGIYNSTLWTKVNSPYIVTGNIVVFPGKTLTLEPGVKVRFDGNYNIEIRGRLIAIGTVIDSITFSSNTTPVKSAWENISILNNTQNAVGFFRYCNVLNSNNGIQIECCFGNDSTYIKNSIFDNNNFALTGYSGWSMPIDNCIFNNNNKAITEADKSISNSLFTNNGIGINCERFEVTHSTFHNNNGAIDWTLSTGMNQFVDSCEITNNIIGIRTPIATITNCNISDNDYGIISKHSSYTYNGNPFYVPIKNNKICNNAIYNIQNDNNFNKDVTQNCFCADSVGIESKLKDGYDDITLGLFNYDIYDSTCQVLLQTVYKVGGATGLFDLSEQHSNDIEAYPNPFGDYLLIKLTKPQTEIYNVRIINLAGQEIQAGLLTNGEIRITSLGYLESGMYFIQLLHDKAIVSQKKIIKR